jgi:peptidoglycan/xylan/chitin deacetylase (PgdA/CDA1 family)
MSDQRIAAATGGAGAATGGAGPGRLRLGQVPIILMYHNVADAAEDPHGVCISPDRFAEQLAWLKERKLRGVSVGVLVDAMSAGCERGLVGITLDDGYVSVLEHAVPELLRHEFTATMFIVSDLLGGTNVWDDDGPVWRLLSARQVADIADAGMEIGSHSATHIRLAGMAPQRLAAEVSASRARLSEIIGRPVRGFAYPWGNMDAAARRAVKDAGYDYACSVETPLADLGLDALPRIEFFQNDGPGRMAAKRLFFRSYTAARGTKRRLSYSPVARAIKQQVLAAVRPLAKSP